MLKAVEPVPDPASERPVGEIVHELIEDGKAYARAEFELYRTIATTKSKAFALPAGLFALSLVIAIAALNALAFGVVLALARFIGPLAGGVAGTLLLLLIAGGVAWYATYRLRRDL